MTDTTANAQQQSGEQQKRDAYNIEGYLRDMKSGQTQEGKTWTTFKLHRTNGKKPVSCKAFDEIADALLAKGEGAPARLFGTFRTETFKGRQDGRQIRFQSFKAIRQYEPQYVGTDAEYAGS